MRLSRYFLPVLKETPAEAQIVSHRLMLRAGMIKQQAAGIYSWLPLGLKVLRRVEQIVHELERNTHVPPKRIRGIAHSRSARALVRRHRCQLIRPCATAAQDRR